VRPTLEGCRAKLDRSKEHLEALEREVSAYLSDPQRGPTTTLQAEHDAFGRAWAVARLRLPSPPPARLGLLAGDAIHNARSALDHLVCRLVELNNKKLKRSNAFPIYEHRPTDPDKKARFKGNLRGLSKSHAKAITDLQPFTRPHVPESQYLIRLGALDNLDKHQLVFPVLGVVRTRPGDLTEPIEWRSEESPLEDGVEVFRARPVTGGGRWFNLDVGTRYIVNFRDPTVTRANLEAIRAYVVGIVESFAPDFPK
jgi:hypothetical protein